MSSGRYVLEGAGPWFVTDLAEPSKAAGMHRNRADAEAQLARLEAKHARTQIHDCRQTPPRRGQNTTNVMLPFGSEETNP